MVSLLIWIIKKKSNAEDIKYGNVEIEIEIEIEIGSFSS